MPPTRASITAAALIALIAAAATVACLLRGDWLWTLAGTACTATLIHEALRDLADRRHHRNDR